MYEVLISTVYQLFYLLFSSILSNIVAFNLCEESPTAYNLPEI